MGICNEDGGHKAAVISLNKFSRTGGKAAKAKALEIVSSYVTARRSTNCVRIISQKVGSLSRDTPFSHGEHDAKVFVFCDECH